jgi:hypothetical protein
MGKLYTEEQVINAIGMARDVSIGLFDREYYDFTEDEIISKLTPTELPNDEEINKEAMYLFGIDSTLINDILQYKAFKRGAKWMRDKIGGNNG